MQNERPTHAMQVQRIEHNQVWINDAAKSLPLCIHPSGYYAHPLPTNPLNLKPEHLMPLLEDGIDLLLIGSGDAFIAPPEALSLWCYEHKLGMEAMNNQAACRAFQMLCVDERKVALLLFPGETL